MKLTKIQKKFLDSLENEDGYWCECFYPEEWRIATNLMKKGLIEIMDNEETAKNNGRFEARIKNYDIEYFILSKNFSLEDLKRMSDDLKKITIEEFIKLIDKNIT